MKKNSIEEDIKKVENYLENSNINETNSNFFKNGGWEVVDLEIPKAMQHILADYKRALKENEYMHKELDKQQTTINKYAEENEQLKNAVAVANELEKRIKKKFIPKADIEAIVCECIPREKNIFTGKVEYRTNTNANSFLTQEILKLLESEE